MHITVYTVFSRVPHKVLKLNNDVWWLGPPATKDMGKWSERSCERRSRGRGVANEWKTRQQLVCSRYCVAAQTHNGDVEP